MTKYNEAIPVSCPLATMSVVAKIETLRQARPSAQESFGPSVTPAEEKEARIKEEALEILQASGARQAALISKKSFGREVE